jgi:hypothetical protein
VGPVLRAHLELIQAERGCDARVECAACVDLSCHRVPRRRVRDHDSADPSERRSDVLSVGVLEVNTIREIRRASERFTAKHQVNRVHGDSPSREVPDGRFCDCHCLAFHGASGRRRRPLAQEHELRRSADWSRVEDARCFMPSGNQVGHVRAREALGKFEPRIARVAAGFSRDSGGELLRCTVSVLESNECLRPGAERDDSHLCIGFCENLEKVLGSAHFSHQDRVTRVSDPAKIESTESAVAVDIEARGCVRAPRYVKEQDHDPHAAHAAAYLDPLRGRASAGQRSQRFDPRERSRLRRRFVGRLTRGRGTRDEQARRERGCTARPAKRCGDVSHRSLQRRVVGAAVFGAGAEEFVGAGC